MPVPQLGGRQRQLQVLDHPRAGEAEGLAGFVVCPDAAVTAVRRADDGQRRALDRPVAERAGQPIDRILQHPGHAAVVFGSDDQHGVGVRAGFAQRPRRFRHGRSVDVLVVEGNLAEPVEYCHLHAGRRRFRGQFRQLAVDRGSPQASHQHQHRRVRVLRHVHPPLARHRPH